MIEEILHNKQLKAKAKVESISKLLVTEKITSDELIKVAKSLQAPEKATCIEAIEFATKTKPEVATLACLKFVTQTLTDEAPRVKWESAKVIVNIAKLFPSKLDEAIKNLLVNTEYSGTVVRWSAAQALGAILKLKTKHNKNLVPEIEAINKREEDNAIKKIYLKALKNI
jgi:hypothetical protein